MDKDVKPRLRQPASKRYTVKGPSGRTYTVTVHYRVISEEDAAQKRDAIARAVAAAIKRQRGST